MIKLFLMNAIDDKWQKVKRLPLLVRSLILSVMVTLIVTITYGQQPGPIIIPEDGRKGFYAMIPENIHHQKRPVTNKIKLIATTRSGYIRSRSLRRKSPKITSSPVRIGPHPRFLLKGPKGKHYKPWRK